MGSTSDTGNGRDWSSLPDEIWAAIGGHLAADRFDVTRFRSVCNSWRSLIPRYNHSSSSSPPLPRFSFPLPPYSVVDSFVSEAAVYRIDRPFASDLHPRRRSRGWLVKVDTHAGDRIHLLDALSCHMIRDIDKSGAFRLSEFRVSEITRTYALRYVRGSSSIAGVNKLILNPNSSRERERSVFVIYDNGKLGFAKDGDDDMTLVDSRILDYNDIIVHKGQPYVVDRWGTVSWIDSSLKPVQYAPPMFGNGGRKHLVVSSGELYVVDRYLDENSAPQYPDEGISGFNIFHRHPLRRRRFDHLHPKSVDFKVFKLDEEWGRWDEVKNLGESSFVLTYDCSFSVVADDFDGFEANCIYFTEQFDMDFALRRLGRQGGCVFRLEDGTIEELELTPGYSNIFSQHCPDQIGNAKEGV